MLPSRLYRIPVAARFSAPVQTGPGAHAASYTMSTGSFPGVKSGWGVTLTPHRLLVLWSRQSRAIPPLPLWAVWPVQSLSACTRVHFNFSSTTALQFYSTLSINSTILGAKVIEHTMCFVNFPTICGTIRKHVKKTIQKHK